MKTKNTKTPRRKAYRSALRIHVLGIIIMNNRVHGYGIYKQILENTGLVERFGRPSVGTIYRVLNNLVEEGLITRKKERVGGRTLYYYTPTRKGLEEFARICEAFLDKVGSGTRMILSALPALHGSGIDVKGIIERLEEIENIIRESLVRE